MDRTSDHQIRYDSSYTGRTILRTQRVQSSGGFVEIDIKAARLFSWAAWPLVEAARPLVEAARPVVTPLTVLVHKIFFLYLPLINRLARNLFS
jgi:hypothetical protein